MKQLLKNLVREESGQDLIEYALVATLIALSSVAVMRAYRTNLTGLFNGIGIQLSNA
jgi:pilus assembly protein Flp/PilA